MSNIMLFDDITIRFELEPYDEVRTNDKEIKWTNR